MGPPADRLVGFQARGSVRQLWVLRDRAWEWRATGREAGE
jgi:hypothetical protein